MGSYAIFRRKFLITIATRKYFFFLRIIVVCKIFSYFWFFINKCFNKRHFKFSYFWFFINNGFNNGHFIFRTVIFFKIFTYFLYIKIPCNIQKFTHSLKL